MVEVRVEPTYGAAKKFIAAGLEDFNRRHMNAGTPKSFAVTALDEGAARGGVMVEGVGAWMYLTLLWVEEGFRRRGFGTSLLQKAELEAKERGAMGLLVDTFSFQAPDFYRKHGYSAYGQIADFPQAGMVWHRFKKTL
ncbi:MAG: GNAT family N-acetyltransferase [Phreatobacter sp.]|uniref:GNAT family N-acetyltransferase n=1 Tax=Phreatobacter sp. TaxID=1966341 RepID=UPI001A3B04BE|nr:GNAT family N-acetyltransferase [Phreatobacter sp.]MBL8568170.1 GNAT family N-acetyltransferase [Phreatobacter sp.]